MIPEKAEETRPTSEPDWLRWSRALHALAQAGLTYTDSPYDRERYQAIREISAEMMASGGNLGKAEILDLFRSQTGYATPKVDVRGIVFRGEELLLVQEGSDGLWTVPGGWADPNETPSQAVMREIREESGFETEVVRLLAVYDRALHGHVPLFPFHVYKLFVLCRLIGGEARSSHETSAVGFYRLDALPPLSRGHFQPHQLRRFRAMVQQGIETTDFD